MLLAGDIGGTKTTLALLAPDGDPRHPLYQETFASADAAGLAQLVRQFLHGHTEPIDRACFGVAGPVVDGRAKITNLPWIVDVAELKRALGSAQVILLNDLEAVANAVPHLAGDELITLNAGVPEEHGPIGVIAPGTGLGEAYLTWAGRRYRAHPSEGGHGDFAPTTDQQVALFHFIHAQTPHVSYEKVCSGRGLPNLYQFLKASGVIEPPWLAEQMAAPGADPGRVIVENAFATDTPAEIARRTIHLFAIILGAEAGNMALRLLATGGIYIGGGIPPRILPALRDPDFMEAFTTKGRLTDVLARTPLRVIVDSQAALYGAAFRVLDHSD